jgi:DNA-binding response OmpR family regulator
MLKGQSLARVLVVEDDARIAELVRMYLARDGHEVLLSGNGRDGVRMAAEDAPDLIVLDLMLPGLHGRDACLAIRQRSAAPIVMLTALDDPRDVVEGLDAGADDYITKPFDPNVLVARVRAALRRGRGAVGVVRETRVGNLSLLPAERVAGVAGARVELRARELDLLLALAARPGQVLTRAILLETVWGRDHELDIDTRTVDVHINRLRARLDAAGADARIETLRGVGYRLVADERDDTHDAQHT